MLQHRNRIETSYNEVNESHSEMQTIIRGPVIKKIHPSSLRSDPDCWSSACTYSLDVTSRRGPTCTVRAMFFANIDCPHTRCLVTLSAMAPLGPQALASIEKVHPPRHAPPGAFADLTLRQSRTRRNSSQPPVHPQHRENDWRYFRARR